HSCNSKVFNASPKLVLTKMPDDVRDDALTLTSLNRSGGWPGDELAERLVDPLLKLAGRDCRASVAQRVRQPAQAADGGATTGGGASRTEETWSPPARFAA